jgi:hypothetical protein
MWGAIASATDKHLRQTSMSARGADNGGSANIDPLSFSAPPPGTNTKETDLGNMRRVVPQTALGKHVTKIIHHHRGKKMNLASALLSHSKLANIVNGQNKKGWPSPPSKKKSVALQKFKARARKLIADERNKKEEEASCDAHPRLEYLNAQAYTYLRKCEYEKLQIVKTQEKIKRAKKARIVLWKLRREHQAKKDLERRWTPRDVEHREFDLVTAKQDYSITRKDSYRQKKKVDEMRKVILGKHRAKAQIQEFIDKAVRGQQAQADQAHMLETETAVLAREYDAEEKAERHLQLEWEQEYGTVCRETEQLERKSLDQRMKETQHVTAVTVAGETLVSIAFVHPPPPPSLALLPSLYPHAHHGWGRGGGGVSPIFQILKHIHADTPLFRGSSHPLFSFSLSLFLSMRVSGAPNIFWPRKPFVSVNETIKRQDQHCARNAAAVQEQPAELAGSQAKNVFQASRDVRKRGGRVDAQTHERDTDWHHGEAGGMV